MSKVFCPFCLTIHDFGEPPVCLERLDNESGGHPDVSRSYIHNYDRSQPLWLAAIGFSNHGKTSYIGSLSLLLDSADKFWEGSATDYLDQYTFQKIQDTHKTVYDRKNYDRTRKWGEVAEGETRMPNKTQSPPRPLLIRIDGIPKFQSRCLVLYDAAGEYFETLTGIQEGVEQSGYIKSLKAVRTIWFMVSLSDLASPENSQSKNLRDLLNVYIAGMERMGWDIRNRNLIVVYTKADKLKHIEHVPPSIREYLSSDRYGQLVGKINYADPNTFFQGVEREEFNLDQYISDMEETSNELEDYTKKLAGGSAFLTLAKNHGLKVYFTITSALGTDSQDGEAIADFTSYRVLDPLLWALKLDEKPPIPTTIKIILDTAHPKLEAANKAAGNPIYSLPYDYLMRELGKIGDEVVAYYLGNNKPGAPSGQKPPSSVAKQIYPRLLRPLLSNNDANTLALVFTNGPIEDFDEFLDSESTLNRFWKNRLFVVSLSSNYEPTWKWRINFNSDDAPEIIVNQFKRMLTDLISEGE